MCFLFLFPAHHGRWLVTCVPHYHLLTCLFIVSLGLLSVSPKTIKPRAWVYIYALHHSNTYVLKNVNIYQTLHHLKQITYYYWPSFEMHQNMHHLHHFQIFVTSYNLYNVRKCVKKLKFLCILNDIKQLHKSDMSISLS